MFKQSSLLSLIISNLQTPGLNIMSEYIIGYIYPGYPIANMCFKVYGNISMKQAVTFLKDFKLGHYMKIPPRAMFIAQVTFFQTYVLFKLKALLMLLEEILENTTVL